MVFGFFWERGFLFTHSSEAKPSRCRSSVHWIFAQKLTSSFPEFQKSKWCWTCSLGRGKVLLRSKLKHLWFCGKTYHMACFTWEKKPYVGSSDYRGHQGVSGTTKDVNLQPWLWVLSLSYFFIENTPPCFVIVGGSHYIWKCLQFRKCCSQSPRQIPPTWLVTLDLMVTGTSSIQRKGAKVSPHMPNATPVLVLFCNTCSLPSLLFLLFLAYLWPITLLAVSGVVCCCPHAADGGIAHIYFMTDILKQALNSSTLCLLKASAATNPSCPPFRAAPGKVSLLFIFLSHTARTTVCFCSQRFTLRLLAWMTLELENSSTSGLGMERDNESITVSSSTCCAFPWHGG